MPILICAQIFSFVQDWRDVEGAIPYDVCAKILILHKLGGFVYGFPLRGGSAAGGGEV